MEINWAAVIGAILAGLWDWFKQNVTAQQQAQIQAVLSDLQSKVNYLQAQIDAQKAAQRAEIIKTVAGSVGIVAMTAAVVGLIRR